MHNNSTLPRIRRRAIIGAIALAAFAFCGGIPACAQSPFSTAKTDGSIVLDTGGFLQASFEKTEFRVAYELNRQDERAAAVRARNPAKRIHGVPRYGFQIKARPSGDNATLFKGNDVTSGGALTLSYGLGNIASYQPSSKDILAFSDGTLKQGHHLVYDWATFQVTYGRKTSTLYDPSKIYSDQFSKKNSDNYSAQLAYNAEYGGRIPNLLGIAIGVEKMDNAEDLDAVEVKQEQTFVSPDGVTRRTFTTTRKGLLGAYEEKTHATLKTDWVYFPFLNATGETGPDSIKKAKASIAFDLFTRTTLGNDGQFVPGLGVYITAPGAPLKVYGGVTVYRTREKDVTVDVVAGFNF